MVVVFFLLILSFLNPPSLLQHIDRISFLLSILHTQTRSKQKQNKSANRLTVQSDDLNNMCATPYTSTGTSHCNPFHATRFLFPRVSKAAIPLQVFFPIQSTLHCRMRPYTQTPFPLCTCYQALTSLSVRFYLRKRKQALIHIPLRTIRRLAMRNKSFELVSRSFQQNSFEMNRIIHGLYAHGFLYAEVCK